VTWANFLRGRAPASLLSLLVVIFGVFFLARLGGNPTNLYLPLDATQAQRRAFSHQHGFDQPVLVQFVHYLQQLAHFHLGTSLATGESAAQMVWQTYPDTMELIGVTMLVTLILATVLGTIAGRYPNSSFDRAVSLTTLFALGIPNFWFAVMSVLIFALDLHWLPTSGTSGAASWVLPVATLLLRPVGQLLQVVRGSMIEVLGAPYVTTARGKGASEPRVVIVHALRNAALPSVTVAGDIFVSLVNGAVVAETVFGWPGLGQLMVNSINSRDFAVVQAGVLFIAITIFLLNLILDILYAFLDPRVKRAH
jgi:peptide/nickel transport system permease protein